MPHSLEICSVLLIMSNIDENMDGADERDEGGQVLHFEGDFFGHYTEEDFECPDNHGVVEGDKDPDESSDEEVVFDGEIGWEPAVLNAPDVGAPVSGPLEMPPKHIYQGYSQKIAGSENIYAQFESKLDFDIALWAKMRGSGSTAFTDLLAINDVHDRLVLSYRNSRELNNIIDKKLPTCRPQFRRQEVVFAGEAFDVYFRNIVECVKALYEDPEFAPYIVFVPERHYADKEKTMQLYHDMHTGKWWWRTQKEIEKEKPGATIIPIILSSDKTQVTVFGNKTAYPTFDGNLHDMPTSFCLTFQLLVLSTSRIGPLGAALSQISSTHVWGTSSNHSKVPEKMGYICVVVMASPVVVISLFLAMLVIIPSENLHEADRGMSRCNQTLTGLVG
ncbi:hypothetical protein BDR06DRAFT_977962 [Suillus hirtellus]|nr:hypothetical protein BDR06DRAFT_977962 [Suillus hirtellus]